MARVITNPEVGTYYNATGQIEVTDCPNCGIQFGVPRRLIERAREENAAVMGQGKSLTIYCPLGHSIHWTGKNREQELEDRLQQARDRAGRAASRAEQAERRAAAQRGAATRARNERDKAKARIAKGVCPCCNRNFKNVERHMATQHPDYHLPGGES